MLSVVFFSLKINMCISVDDDDDDDAAADKSSSDYPRTPDPFGANRVYRSVRRGHKKKVGSAAGAEGRYQK